MSYAFDTDMEKLGMSANARDIPTLSGAEGPERSWYGTAFFLVRDPSEKAHPTEDEWLTGGGAAFGTTATTLFGLISPGPGVSDLAFRAPLSGLKVTTEGTEGLLKKRPQSIIVEFEDWKVSISMVCSLTDGQARSNRESEFLAVISR